MKKLIALFTAIVLGATMLCGCGSTAEENIQPVDTEATTEATTEAITAVPVNIDYSGLDADEVVQKFAFNIFSEIVESGENSVFSPLSAYYALGMLSLGATDESAEELQGLLGMTSEEVAEWCYEIMQEYAALSDSSTTVLSVSNGVFIDDRLELADGSDVTFTNLEKYYEAECKTMRLSTDAAAVTAEVMVGSAETYPEVIKFDSSFFYAVYDSETGVPLFMGVVDNPTE